MIAQLDTDIPQPSGLYVDVENLQSDAGELLVSLLESWPPVAPKPTKVVLYVPADMVELWRMWALAYLNGQAVEVNGVQHFAATSSKNSADIAIAVEAITDLLKGQVRHVAVFSDDSDFISLFAKIRTETKDLQNQFGRIPMLWILTDRAGTKTPNIQQFFPPEYLHIVRRVILQTSQAPTETTQRAKSSVKPSGNPKSQDELVAEAIIRQIPIGDFKSSDCQKIVKVSFPRHPKANADGSPFGEYVSNKIWPLLEAKGVELLAGSKPRQYRMTQAAKDSVK